MSETRLAYSFAHPHDGTPEELRQLLGGKGAGLAEMTRLGLPVPPGFTLTTEACRRFLVDGWDTSFDDAVRTGLRALEAATGRRLGDDHEPLLVSVRSGAPTSMPGMMDTVLDVGMTDAVRAALARASGSDAFAADTAERARESYVSIVGIDPPADPVDQVLEAVRAVFRSWTGERAVRYREVEGIDADTGTAATVQAMVFGNLGPDSGTGVAFTRDPSSGAAGLMGDFLVGAQGEDVVAGTHATEPLTAMATRWPQAWDELNRIAALLEREYRDMVDIEFTVEGGRLYLLQARRGKRSPIATLRMAIDMAEDPDFPLDRAEAVARCREVLDDPPTVAASPSGDEVALVRGLAAAPGRGVGRLCLDVDEAVRLQSAGEDVVLVRRETAPADVHGMAAARGLVTTLGGLVSHAAVVARSWGLPAVVGAGELQITASGVEGPGGRAGVGDVVTVDGDDGRLLLGAHPGDGAVAPEVAIVEGWARTLDLGADATRAGEGPGIPSEVLDFAAFHFLAIKAMTSTSTLAGMLGVSDEQVHDLLSGPAAIGHAKFHEARDFWQLTPEGRAAHPRALAEQAGGLDLASLPYDDFLALNLEFKQICTDWQLRDGQPNDHADQAYDAAVIDRVVGLHERTGPIAEAIAAIVPWTVRYATRLAAALERLRGGDERALTGVLCDSYHDIWMELHEDLILTQGIDRAAEGST